MNGAAAALSAAASRGAVRAADVAGPIRAGF